MKNASAFVTLLIFTVCSAQAQECPVTGLVPGYLSTDAVAKSGERLLPAPVLCTAGESQQNLQLSHADTPYLSSIEEIWTGAVWQNNSKTEHEYNEENRLTRSLFLRWNAGTQDFINQTATDYFFDESTNTFGNVRSGWNGAAFENQEQNVFQRDAFGNDIRIERFDWENGDWKTRFLSQSVVENGLVTETTIQSTHAQGVLANAIHRTFTYDAAGREAVETEERWDENTQAWTLESREVTTYDNSTIVTTTQKYTGGSWVDVIQSTQVFANDLLLEHTIVPLSGTASGNRFLYTYDTSGNLLEYTAQEEDGAGGWRSYFRNAYTLDPDGDPLELLVQFFDQDRMMWENISRITFSYQSDPAATAVEDESIPGLMSFDVYPYPAKDRVHVALQLSQATDVRLEVFDTLGRRVVDLSNALVSSGNQQLLWSPVSEPAGLYFIRLSIDGAVETRPVTLIK